MSQGYFLTVSLLIALLGLSCTAQHQLYPGEARHPSSIAIIRLDPEAERTKVLQIGEAKVRGKLWHVLPGEYRVVVQAKRRLPLEIAIAPTESYYLYFKAVCETTLLARPGGRYIVTSKGSYLGESDRRGYTSEFQGSVAAWIADEASPREPVSHTKCEITAG
jgi:hypothetical protein